MLRVVVIGYGEMFTNLIAGALDANSNIVGIFRRDMIKYPYFIRKIKDIFNPSLEYNYVKSYNLHELKAKSVNSKEFQKQLFKLNPDIILVGSWGEKISKDIYNLPKIATINAHPSLLPKYRGPNPYFWSIRNGENVSGISFHLVTENYDTGAILAQEEIKIYHSDTGKSLKERTVLTARGVVCELLKDLSEDIIIPLTQTEEKATYYSYPEVSAIDFKSSAEDISALIRASYPWQSAYFYDYNTCLKALPPVEIITPSIENTHNESPGTILDSNYKNKTITVMCGNNKAIVFRVMHYAKLDKFFSANYIKRELYKGKQL